MAVKRIVWVVIGLGIAVALAVPKYKDIEKANVENSGMVNTGKKTGGGPTPVFVTIARPESEEVIVRSNGSLLAEESVELKPEMDGLVQVIHFQEGQRVSKGQLLVSLRVDDQKAQLQKLEYSRDLAKTTEQRQAALLKKEAIAQQEYDMALTTLKTIEADITALKVRISKGSIVAPFSGTMGLRQLSAGSYITTNTSIARLVSTDKLKLDFSVPARYVEQVKAGSPIRFTIEGGEQVHQARVYATATGIDETTRTLLVRGIVEHPTPDMKPGSFVQVTLVLGTNAKAVKVPTEAVVPLLEGHQLFLLKGGKVATQKVVLGTRTTTHVYIADGLASGDTVITSGVQLVKPGGMVNIKGYVN